MLVVPNTREAGVFQVKARTTHFLDVPFTMEPKVHFTWKYLLALTYPMTAGQQEAPIPSPQHKLKSGKYPEFLKRSLLLLGLPIMVLPN